MHFYKTLCEHCGTRNHLSYVLFHFLPLVIVTWLTNLWVRVTLVLYTVGLLNSVRQFFIMWNHMAVTTHSATVLCPHKTCVISNITMRTSKLTLLSVVAGNWKVICWDVLLCHNLHTEFCIKWSTCSMLERTHTHAHTNTHGDDLINLLCFL